MFHNHHENLTLVSLTWPASYRRLSSLLLQRHQAATSSSSGGTPTLNNSLSGSPLEDAQRFITHPATQSQSVSGVSSSHHSAGFVSLMTARTSLSLYNDAVARNAGTYPNNLQQRSAVRATQRAQAGLIIVQHRSTFSTGRRLARPPI